jgi:hypothetical protein
VKLNNSLQNIVSRVWCGVKVFFQHHVAKASSTRGVFLRDNTDPVPPASSHGQLDVSLITCVNHVLFDCSCY